MPSTYRVHAQPAGGAWEYVIARDLDGVVTEQLRTVGGTSAEIALVLARLERDESTTEVAVVPGDDATAAQAVASTYSGDYVTTGPVYERAQDYLQN